jgi:hypothetical protein
MSTNSLVFADRYQVTPIGQVDNGVDGFDKFWLVRDVVDQINADAVEEEFLRYFYRDTDIPGGYFCHRVSISDLPYGNQCIAVVHHQYDV